MKEKKIHLRYFDNVGLATRLGITLTKDQFEWASQLKNGKMYDLHILALPDRHLLFKETDKGSLYGCSLPIDIVNKLSQIYVNLSPFLQ